MTRYTVKFAGATPVTTPPTTAPPTSASPGVCTAPPWNSGTAYTGGAKVSYNGHDYTAKWWTQNEVPSASGPYGPWTDDGPC